jgi:hypothetical protein
MRTLVTSGNVPIAAVRVSLTKVLLRGAERDA